MLWCATLERTRGAPVGPLWGQGEERHARSCLELSDSVDDGIGGCKRYSKSRRNIVKRLLVPEEIAARLNRNRYALRGWFRRLESVASGK